MSPLRTICLSCTSLSRPPLFGGRPGTRTDDFALRDWIARATNPGGYVR